MNRFKLDRFPEQMQCGLLSVLFCSLLLVPCHLIAKDIEKGLRIDLNKTERSDENCRITLVFENNSQDFYQKYYMELAFFNKNGVIAQRITVDAAPLRNNKTTIKEFDVPQLQCNDINRVLLNTISKCEPSSEQNLDCMSLIKLKSHSGIEFLM